MSAATPLINDEVKSLVNSAFEEGGLFSVAMVTPDQKPALSYRGTVRTYSDNQLAFWLRSKGDTLAAIEHNPAIALALHSPAVLMLTFKGVARITTDEAERTKIFDAIPEREKVLDAERKGLAVIVDLDSVFGVLRFDAEKGAAYYKAEREAA